MRGKFVVINEHEKYEIGRNYANTPTIIIRSFNATIKQNYFLKSPTSVKKTKHYVAEARLLTANIRRLCVNLGDCSTINVRYPINCIPALKKNRD